MLTTILQQIDIVQLYVTAATLCCLSVVLLSTFVVVYIPHRKWVAYSKLYQSLEVDSSVLFQQLTSIEYHWHQQELPYQQVQRLTSPAVVESNNVYLLYIKIMLTFFQ